MALNWCQSPSHTVETAAKSSSDLLLVRLSLHQCLERHLGMWWEVPPLGWVKVMTVR